jgi:penicillin-binding protein 1A
VGFAGDLVVGVWVGRDDNKPAGLTGGGAPARIWRDFMGAALNIAPPPAPAVKEVVDENVGDEGLLEGAIPELAPALMDEVEGLGIDLRVGEDGAISVGPARRGRDEPPPEREERRPPEEDEGEEF